MSRALSYYDGAQLTVVMTYRHRVTGLFSYRRGGIEFNHEPQQIDFDGFAGGVRGALELAILLATDTQQVLRVILRLSDGTECVLNEGERQTNLVEVAKLQSDLVDAHR